MYYLMEIKQLTPIILKQSNLIIQHQNYHEYIHVLLKITKQNSFLLYLLISHIPPIILHMVYKFHTKIVKNSHIYQAN